MFDLTTVDGVLQFLSTTSFAASDAIPLLGGYANYTYRIILREPCTVAGSDVAVHTLVLKHAEPYGAMDKNFPYAVERQGFECLALRLVPQIVPPSPVISLPKLYHEDREHWAILMSDSGDTSMTLKDLLQVTALTNQVSHTIGHSLGIFLARLHTSTFGSQGSEIKTAFAANQQGRRIFGLVTYGWLISTVAPCGNEHKFIDPPLNLRPSRLETLASLAKTMLDRINASNDVLTMGDFWTGNLLVTLSPEPHVDVVDWELAKPGLPGLDVGMLIAELHLLRIFHPSSCASVDIIVASFLKAYRRGFNQQNGRACQMEELAWDAATQFGVHLAVWTPRVAWGCKEKTRAAVLEGVEYLMRAVDRDDAWLRTSAVGGLLL